MKIEEVQQKIRKWSWGEKWEEQIIKWKKEEKEMR